jgi:hypothetical protein
MSTGMLLACIMQNNARKEYNMNDVTYTSIDTLWEMYTEQIDEMMCKDDMVDGFEDWLVAEQENGHIFETDEGRWYVF